MRVRSDTRLISVVAVAIGLSAVTSSAVKDLSVLVTSEAEDDLLRGESSAVPPEAEKEAVPEAPIREGLTSEVAKVADTAMAETPHQAPVEIAEATRVASEGTRLVAAEF